VVAGAAYAAWRALADRDQSGLTWEAQPFPNPPRPIPAALPTPVPATGPAPGAESAWVAPDGHDCPVSHPVKANLRSGIFHVPGGTVYDRTVPDRCYRDPASAGADGLRESKR